MRQAVILTKRTTRSKAEEQFTATQKKDEKTLNEREKIRQDQADKVARLRALRLAKEAGDDNTADEADIID